MRKVLFKPIMLLAIVIGLASCYPGGAEYTDDTDLVYTDYNPDYNYGAIKTFLLADSINHIVDEGADIDRSLDSFIFAELRRNLENLGWVEDTVSPDEAIVVSAIKVTNYNIYTMPWYPGWGWGYWKSSDYWGYPGYGWGYPWYGSSYVTSYETGTVSWKMFDPDEVDESNEIIYVNWTGAINGVLGSSTSNTKSRITRGIDQAFKQSTYLQGE